MPHDRDEWIGRIKGIEREHVAARFAIGSLASAAERDPTVLGATLRLRELRHASEHLDGTYVIRLFASFEAGLRLYWATFKKSNPQARGLLDGIAARRSVPQDVLTNAHGVRDYRNSLVHEFATAIGSISVPSVRRDLCIYFSYLPRQW
jgi:hypothetical protein